MKLLNLKCKKKCLNQRNRVPSINQISKACLLMTIVEVENSTRCLKMKKKRKTLKIDSRTENSNQRLMISRQNLKHR